MDCPAGLECGCERNAHEFVQKIHKMNIGFSAVSDGDCGAFSGYADHGGIGGGEAGGTGTARSGMCDNRQPGRSAVSQALRYRVSDHAGTDGNTIRTDGIYRRQSGEGF